MLKFEQVFLNDPERSQIIADLKNRGFAYRSSINQAPVTGEYFPPFEIWEKHTDDPLDQSA